MLEEKALAKWTGDMLLKKTKSLAEEQGNRALRGTEIMEPGVFPQACMVFAEEVLNLDRERADEMGNDVRPFIPLADDELGELFWPLSSSSIFCPEFVLGAERRAHYSASIFSLVRFVV